MSPSLEYLTFVPTSSRSLETTSSSFLLLRGNTRSVATSLVEVPRVSNRPAGFTRNNLSFVLIAALGILWLLYRRTSRSREAAITDSTESDPWNKKHELVSTAGNGVDANPTPCPKDAAMPGEIDLTLLRHLSDDTTEGFHREIQRYLSAFELDLQEAHVIFADGERTQVHRIAHRLIAHSGAVHCEPLISLATTMQSEAANLPQEKLGALLRDFDREFALLRNKLDSLRASTARE